MGGVKKYFKSNLFLWNRALDFKTGDIMEIYENSNKVRELFGGRFDQPFNVRPASHGQLLSQYGYSPSFDFGFVKSSSNGFGDPHDSLILDYIVVRSKEHNKSRQSIIRLIDWLIDQSIDWLFAWLFDRLIDWLLDCLIDSLIDWLIAYLLNCLIDWFKSIDWNQFGVRKKSLECFVLENMRDPAESTCQAFNGSILDEHYCETGNRVNCPSSYSAVSYVTSTEIDRPGAVIPSHCTKALLYAGAADGQIRPAMNTDLSSQDDSRWSSSHVYSSKCCQSSQVQPET